MRKLPVDRLTQSELPQQSPRLICRCSAQRQSAMRNVLQSLPNAGWEAVGYGAQPSQTWHTISSNGNAADFVFDVLLCQRQRSAFNRLE